MAGTGVCGSAGQGGPVAAAQLWNPVAVAVDSAGDLLVADDGDQSVLLAPAHGGTYYGTAVAAGDIGSYFPPSDPQWKGADSAVFLREAVKQVTSRGYAVGNVDCTLVLAAPKIGPHAKAIQESVAALLGVQPDQVGVKAKTPEGTGTDNAAIAYVVVLLTEIMWP